MQRHITFISAGAGSGKTYRLSADLEQRLTGKTPLKPSGVIGTTFTKLAAGELRERVRRRLNERGFSQLANQMDQALLGTVNSVCGQLLSRFAFEAGLSPTLKVIEETEAAQLFNLALEQVLTVETVQTMNALAQRLGLVEDRTQQVNWKEDIRKIVNTARSNNQSEAQIKSSGSASADALLVFLPKPSTKDLDTALDTAVTKAIPSISKAIEQGLDTTKATKDYLALLQDVVTPIKHQNLAWSNWVKLSKAAPAKKSIPLCEAVQQVAATVEQHPRLKTDICQYCEHIFTLAAAALAQFQNTKKSRGLIDYTDQEHLLYEALDQPDIKNVLRDDLDLLLVDEFQDTSPIQLALFLRLATLAKQVIWVGDVKQAIYGFRGSDPELMQAILHHLETNGGRTEILPTSWRSRSELVSYVNEVFVPAFADILPKVRVALRPKPKSVKHPQSAVEHWHTPGRNKEDRALAVAKGLQEFIAGSYLLQDKESSQLRNANYGDVAILCRTHDNLATLAKALAAFQIPVSRSQTGLLQTPEAALVLAAIRYLVDPSDTLATAEIICLTQGQAPETWLQARLDYLATDAKPSQWGESVPLLQALASQRVRLQYLTPLEIMSQAMHSADIRRVILHWQSDTEQAKQRLLNLEQLLVFAETYEHQCANEGRVATITGLLLWLQQLAKDAGDTQAVNAGTQAVQLLTHHGAKGLEWPVVIAMDLDANIRNNLWGLTVEADNSKLDITNPLQSRSLRYWLWPFGKQANGIPFKDNVEQSAYGKAAQRRALAEAKRLLYVSLTRPRDCLILPLQHTDGEWLQCLNADWMLPLQDAKTLKLPLSEENIPVAFKLLTQPEAPKIATTQVTMPHWFVNIPPTQSKPPANISPSLRPPTQANISETIILGDRITLKDTPDMARLGEAIHALIATYLINTPKNPKNPKKLAEQVLTSYAVTAHISIDDALLCVTRFENFIKKNLSARAIKVEYPVTYRLPNGQVASGWIDALVETEQGYIIIDHKSNPQAKSEWKTIAMKYSGQLALYKEAVEAITQKPVIGCWIHFAVTGGILKLTF